LAWLFLGQGISWLHVAGAMVTITGVVGALTSRGGRQLWVATVPKTPGGAPRHEDFPRPGVPRADADNDRSG
jgi:hypothetical protein